MGADDLATHGADAGIGAQPSQSGGNRAGGELHVVVQVQNRIRRDEFEAGIAAAEVTDVGLEPDQMSPGYIAGDMAGFVGRPGVNQYQFDGAAVALPQRCQRLEREGEVVVQDHQHADIGRPVEVETQLVATVGGQQGGCLGAKQGFRPGLQRLVRGRQRPAPIWRSVGQGNVAQSGADVERPGHVEAVGRDRVQGRMRTQAGQQPELHEVAQQAEAGVGGVVELGTVVVQREQGAWIDQVAAQQGVKCLDRRPFRQQAGIGFTNVAEVDQRMG